MPAVYVSARGLARVGLEPLKDCACSELIEPGRPPAAGAVKEFVKPLLDGPWVSYRVGAMKLFENEPRRAMSWMGW